MKKLLTILAVSSFLIVGCENSAEEPIVVDETEEVQELNKAMIQLMDSNDIVLVNEEVEFDNGATLEEIMKDNFELETENGFVTGIEGHSQSPEENIWLVFEINGEMISTGIEDTIINDGDRIAWILEQF